MDWSKLDTTKMLVKPLEPFEITRRCKINTGYICNAKCHFCYFKDNRTRNFGVDTIKHQMDVAIKYGVRDVDFSGGEPTIHQDFLNMLEYAKSSGFRGICAITNGTTFHDKSFLKECQDAGLNDILFSLHGPRHIQNGIMRVRNAYEKMIKSIENANEVGVRCRVNSVVSSKTFVELPAVASILNNHDIFNYNIISFKHCYDQTDAGVGETPRQIDAVEYIKEAIDTCYESVDYINVRYIPFCLMNGYEKHVVNYQQKKYDPLEWLNILLVKFYQGEAEINAMCLETQEDVENENNIAIKNYSSNSYIKSNQCVRCRHFFVCDGFETGYANKFDIEAEIDPWKNTEKIIDPMYYRYKYYAGVCK